MYDAAVLMLISGRACKHAPAASPLERTGRAGGCEAGGGGGGGGGGRSENSFIGFGRSHTTGAAWIAPRPLLVHLLPSHYVVNVPPCVFGHTKPLRNLLIALQGSPLSAAQLASLTWGIRASWRGVREGTRATDTGLSGRSCMRAACSNVCRTRSPYRATSSPMSACRRVRWLIVCGDRFVPHRT